jgi:hypothetical protein
VSHILLGAMSLHLKDQTFMTKALVLTAPW